MRKKVLVVLLSMALVGMMVCVGDAQQKAATPTYNWKLQATHVAGDPPFQWLFPRLAKNLDEFSNGRIKLNYFSGGALVPVAETLNMLGKGVFEMGESVGAYWQGLIPVAGLEFGFPGAWHSPDDFFSLLYDKGLQDVLRNAYAEQNVRYVTGGLADPFSLESVSPFKNLNDLRKLKVRSIGAPTNLLNNLGIRTVQVAWPELYTALKLGTVDACTVGIYYWYQAKMPELCKYVLWPPLYNPASINIMMNLKVWNELPPDIKQIVNYSVQDAVWYLHRQDTVQRDLMYDKLKKDYKVQFVELPDNDKAELRKASVELWGQLRKKDKYTEQFMKIVEEFAKSKGYIN
jgi:TRAP-type C4-dicarboxylate transport system substrate-binding protein